MNALTFLGGASLVGASLANVLVEFFGGFLCDADAFGVVPELNPRCSVKANSDKIGQLNVPVNRCCLSIIKSYKPFLTALARDHKSSIIFAATDTVWFLILVFVVHLLLEHGGDLVLRHSLLICIDILRLSLATRARSLLLGFLRRRCGLGGIQPCRPGSRLARSRSSAWPICIDGVSDANRCRTDSRRRLDLQARCHLHAFGSRRGHGCSRRDRLVMLNDDDGDSSRRFSQIFLICSAAESDDGMVADRKGKLGRRSERKNMPSIDN